MTEVEIPKYLFDDAPLNVYWETTIACSLACQHCRAAAISQRDPDELTTEEGCRLIDDVGRLGSLLILTGGDPLERPDLIDLVAYARSRRVSVAVTPSTTPSLKRDTVARLKELGITALGVSLDGPTPDVHDAFRGVAGTFVHSQSALAWAREYGVTVQVNSTVTQFTRPHLDAMFELLVRNSPPVRRWSLFLLIPTGRGRNLMALDARQVEELFEWTYKVSEKAPFHISTVEAPHYPAILDRAQAGRRFHGGPTGAAGPTNGVRGPRRQRRDFRGPERRRVSSRVPSVSHAWQCEANAVVRPVSQVAGSRRFTRHGCARRPLREVPVSLGVRRITCARLGCHGAPAWRGSSVRLSTAINR